MTEYPHEVVFKEEEIELGKAIKVASGEDITIAALGPQLKNALIARDSLQSLGISAEIIYYHSFKPFDSESIKKSVSKTKHLISLEELSAHDGLFNQCLHSIFGIPDIKICQMAVKDFIRGYGSYEELCKSAGLSHQDVVDNAIKLLNR